MDLEQGDSMPIGSKEVRMRGILKVILALSGVIMTTSVQAKNTDMKNPAVARVDLIEAQISKSVERVDVKRIDLAPGQKAGAHFHPCPVVGYIVAGSIVFAAKGEPSKILKAGDVFYEPAHKLISNFDNASDHESARFIAMYLLGAEDKSLIEMIK